MSTTPIRHTTQSISTEINYQTNNKPKTISQNSEFNKTSSKERKKKKVSEKRKQYMEENMKEGKIRYSKKKEIQRKKSYNKKYKNSDPEKVKQSWQKAAATYRKSNPEKVKQSYSDIQKKKKFKEKNHFTKSIKIQILKKLSNLGKKLLPHTENQIQRRLSNHVRKPLTLTYMLTLKRLKNLGRELLRHTENQREKFKKLFKISTALYQKLNPEKVSVIKKINTII